MVEILPRMSNGQRVTIDGFAVPRVEVTEDLATGRWHFVFDGRFSVIAETLEELNRWLWIVANAQAVGEGYSCHGENSVWRPNPHKVQVMCIGTVEKTTDTREG